MHDVPDSVVWLLSGLGLSSLLVHAVAVQRLLQRQPLLVPVEQPAGPVPAVSVAIAAAWVVSALVAAATRSAADIPVPGVADIRYGVLVNGVLFGVIALPLLTGDRLRTRRLGFRLDQWLRQTGHGVIGFLASLFPVGLVFGLTFPLRTEHDSHALLRLLETDQSPETVFWVALSAAVVAPLVEELIYRVVIQSSLERLLSPAAGVVVAAVVFSAVHRFPDAIPLLPLALILGYLYRQRRSFLTIVVVHALFNATNLVVLLLSVQKD